MKPEPRSRRQTRAAILEHLLREKGAFRPQIAESTALSEASLSRIMVDLRGEQLLNEERRPAPYVGGPSNFITLSKNVGCIGIELSNARLSLGIGSLSGPVVSSAHHVAPETFSQDAFEQLCSREMVALKAEAGHHRLQLVQAAVSLPGFGGAIRRANPIFPWDVARLTAFLTQLFSPVPVVLTNPVLAQAAFDRYAGRELALNDDHFFVFAGHGVAGALVSGAGVLDAFSPVEFGHTVLQRGGLRCRCGHQGCLEAYTSLGAVSSIVDMPETEMLALGDRWFDSVDLTSRKRAELRDRLMMLGIGIGNALNLHEARTVVISGWPALLDPDDRAEIARGIDDSLLGGFDANAIKLLYRAPSTGNDPAAAIAFAAYAFVRSGAFVHATSAPIPSSSAA
jgi:predicted NBD/HSP70 family sugar kinase